MSLCLGVIFWCLTCFFFLPHGKYSYTSWLLPYLFRTVSQSWEADSWATVLSKTLNKLNSQILCCAFFPLSWYNLHPSYVPHSYEPQSSFELISLPKLAPLLLQIHTNCSVREKQTVRNKCSNMMLVLILIPCLSELVPTLSAWSPMLETRESLLTISLLTAQFWHTISNQILPILSPKYFLDLTPTRHHYSPYNFSVPQQLSLSTATVPNSRLILQVHLLSST